jgi:hypothetical protein
VGLNPSKYATHSARCGAAVAAASTGATPAELAELGRWKSADMPLAYIRGSAKGRNAANALVCTDATFRRVNPVGFQHKVARLFFPANAFVNYMYFNAFTVDSVEQRGASVADLSSMQMVSVSLNFTSLVIAGSCCRIAVSDICGKCIFLRRFT